jgi:hypothetical protein
MITEIRWLSDDRRIRTATVDEILNDVLGDKILGFGIPYRMGIAIEKYLSKDHVTPSITQCDGCPRFNAWAMLYDTYIDLGSLWRMFRGSAIHDYLEGMTAHMPTETHMQEKSLQLKVKIASGKEVTLYGKSDVLHQTKNGTWVIEDDKTTENNRNQLETAFAQGKKSYYISQVNLYRYLIEQTLHLVVSEMRINFFLINETNLFPFYVHVIKRGDKEGLWWDEQKCFKTITDRLQELNDIFDETKIPSVKECRERMGGSYKCVSSSGINCPFWDTICKAQHASEQPALVKPDNKDFDINAK